MRSMGKREDEEAERKRYADEQTVKSCTGITYFTSAMKAKGEKAWCIGRRGTIPAAEASPPEVIEAAADPEARNKEKRGKKQEEKARETTFLCLGYSQTTARMERQGTLPLCDIGMRFLVISAATADADRRKIPSRFSGDKNGPQAGELDGEVLRPPFSMGNLEEYATKARERTTKAFAAAQTFWIGALKTFPVDFQKFSTKLVGAMAKQAAYIGKTLGKITKAAATWVLDR